MTGGGICGMTGLKVCWWKAEAGWIRPGALWVMAQYIELNAVRAGIVEEAQAYRWCGLGEAVGGGSEARRGICSVFREEVGWNALYMRCIVVR